MGIKEFDSIEDLFAEMRENTRRADAAATEWQKQIVPGVYFLRIIPEYGLAIYGEVLDPMAELSDDMDEEEQADLLAEASIYQEPHMVGYRPTRCFSKMCDYGEMGDVHVSTIATLLSKEQFELARSLGWPSDPVGLKKVFSIKPS